MTTTETLLGIAWMGFGAYYAGVGARTGVAPLSLHALSAGVAFVGGLVLLSLSEESDVRLPEVSG